MFSNDFKYFVISDTTQKYEEINKKILKFTKIYFNLTKNYYTQLIQIENKINNYNNFGEIKITQLIENQHKIIKELVKIINDIFLEKINSEVIKKLEGKSLNTRYEPLTQKKIIMNKNLDIFSHSNYFSKTSNYIQNNKKEKIYKDNNYIKNNIIKNNIKNNLNKKIDDNLISRKLNDQKKIIPINIITPRTNNEFNGAISFLNINSNNIINNFKSSDKYSYKKIEYSPIKTISNFDNNKSLLKHNNINNISYYMNTNYTIDEEKTDNYSTNERQITIISNNNDEDDNSTLPDMLTLRKKRIKYRSPNTKPSEKNLNNNRNYNKHFTPSKSELHIKIPPTSFLSSFNKNSEDCHYNKRSNTSFNFFKSNLCNMDKEKGNLLKVVKTRMYSVPYINNGKINTKSRLTKEILNTSYKKLNKFKRMKCKTLYD